MPSPNSVFTEMVTTTLRNHRKEVADNVSNKNALWQRLTKKGKVRIEDGGYEIVCPLDYAENGTFTRYSGFDHLDISASDVISAAKYDWKNAASHVVASGEEIRKNSGRSALIKLSTVRTKNATRSMANNLSSDLYSDGLSDGGKQITGVQAIIADSGTGSVGGISGTDYAFWRNVVQSAASPLQGGGSITPSKTTIKSLMLPLWLALSRGNEHPSIIVSADDYFTFYWESLTDLQRYTDDKADEAVTGFQTLKFVTGTVIHDGGSGIPSSRMYFINEEYFELVIHKDANLEQLDQQKSINQDAVVIPIIWMGNLTCSNRSMQGVLKP